MTFCQLEMTKMSPISTFKITKPKLNGQSEDESQNKKNEFMPKQFG